MLTRPPTLLLTPAALTACNAVDTLNPPAPVVSALYFSNIPSMDMTYRYIRRLFVLALTLFAMLPAAHAEDWIDHYYEHPTPDRFVPEVRALSQGGHLANPKTAPLISVFLGRVMAANPARVDAWLTQLGDLKGADRQTLLFAAALSRTREARDYLGRQPDAGKYRETPMDIRTIEPNDAAVLDMLWADFFATGETAPIRRIVGALNYAKYAGAIDRYAKSEKTDKDRNDAMLESVFRAALWSLESNAEQHPRVAEHLEQIYFKGELTPPEQQWLPAILAKAMPQKYELSSSAAGQWTFKQRNPAADASAGWRNSEGKPFAETDSMKSKDGFGGSLLATTDEDWKEKWNTPPENAPNFHTAGSVPYGKKVFILTFFANPKLDESGKADVRCDLLIRAPTGKASLEQKDATCFSGALAGNAYALRLSAPVIAFSGDPGDPPGTWSIEVVLRDAVRKVELPLRTSFELKQP